MMSAFLEATFAELAPYLHDYGYPSVPIKPGSKAPLIEGWQDPKPPSHYLPHCARWGTGILTATCPALDIDIRDRELVRVLIDLAGEMIGPGPFRVGSPPKALLPFALAPGAAPFDKIASDWLGLPGDNWAAPGYAPHRVELLGRGQQFVAYARHPRGSWYRWRRGEPMCVCAIDLPEVDHDRAAAFIALATDVLLETGAVKLRKDRGRWRPDLTVERPPPPRATTGRAAGDRGDSSWQTIEPEKLALKIDPRHARRTRGGWICSCPAHLSQGHRSLSITPRTGGGSVVHCFAACPFPEIADAISAIVGRKAA